MSDENNKEITNNELAASMKEGFKHIETLIEEKIEEKIDGLAASTARGFKEVHQKMSTKEDILALQTDISGLRNDFKSFKNDNSEDVEKIEEDIADLNQTDLLHDKRIEKLENKVFPKLNVI